MFLEQLTHDSLRAFQLFGSMKFSHTKQQLGKQGIFTEFTLLYSLH